MPVEKFGSSWQIELCLPNSSLSLLDENDMKKCFNWFNLRPMFCNENNSKKAKIKYHLCLL